MITKSGNQKFCFPYKQERFPEVRPDCEIFCSDRENHCLCCVLFFCLFVLTFVFLYFSSPALSGLQEAVGFGGPLSTAAFQENWQRSLSVSPPEFLKAKTFTKCFCLNRLYNFAVALEGFQLPLVQMPFCQIKTLGSFPIRPCTYEAELNSHL